MVKATLSSLKAILNDLGAKSTGTKTELQDRQGFVWTISGWKVVYKFIFHRLTKLKNNLDPKFNVNVSSVLTLKAKLKFLGLKCTGKKADLQDR